MIPGVNFKKSHRKSRMLKTYAFIDASNLFYGGVKSLGWSIDYQKMLNYLMRKYNARKLFYFGGVELHNFRYDYLTNDSVPLAELERYLSHLIKHADARLSDGEIVLINRHLRRIRFYQNLEEFGYYLFLKPVKIYDSEDDGGGTKKKANCDVEMTLQILKHVDEFQMVIILSGDGDFLPVLKYLKEIGKIVLVLARGPRTAREIRQFAGPNFKDFVRLESYIKFDQLKREGHTKYPPHV